MCFLLFLVVVLGVISCRFVVCSVVNWCGYGMKKQMTVFWYCFCNWSGRVRRGNYWYYICVHTRESVPALSTEIYCLERGLDSSP
jgi:hypothetical protein